MDGPKALDRNQQLWNKPDGKRQKQYDFTHTWNIILKSNKRTNVIKQKQTHRYIQNGAYQKGMGVGEGEMCEGDQIQSYLVTCQLQNSSNPVLITFWRENVAALTACSLLGSPLSWWNRGWCVSLTIGRKQFSSHWSRHLSWVLEWINQKLYFSSKNVCVCVCVCVDFWTWNWDT